MGQNRGILSGIRNFPDLLGFQEHTIEGISRFAPGTGLKAKKSSLLSD
jgi:hypothetical protein